MKTITSHPHSRSNYICNTTRPRCNPRPKLAHKKTNKRPTFFLTCSTERVSVPHVTSVTILTSSRK